MIKKIKAFSLIEVIVASSILTISVFGIYKLIGENNKIINNSSNYINNINLFPIIEECIEYIGYNVLNNNVGYNTPINFSGSLEGCLIGNTNQIIIDNIEYMIDIEITGTGINYIDWQLNIDSSFNKLFTGSYRQFKK